MRLLLVPTVTFRNLASESDYLMYRYMVEDMERLEPLYSYFWLPKAVKDQGKPRQSIKLLYGDGQKEVAYMEHHDQLASVGASFLDFFGPRNCVFPVDAVVTSRADVVPSLVRELWDWRAKQTLIPVILRDSQIMNIAQTEANETWLLTRLLGYVMSYPLFETEENRDQAIALATKYLRPTLVKKLADHSQVMACTVDFASLDRALERHQRGERFTLFFGGRLNAAKRAKNLVQLLEEFWQFGREVDVVVCSPKSDAKVKIKPPLRLLTALNRQEFLERAAQAHVYLNTSKAEGFSVGFIEQTYMVPVSVVPDLPWCRSLLDGADKLHPFKYRTFEEARAMLRWVYQNYEEAVEKIRPVRAYLRQRYDNVVLSEQVLALVKSAVERVELKLSGQQADLLARSWKELPAEFSLADCWKLVRGKMLAHNPTPERGELWRWHTYKWLCQQATDLGNSEVPVFSRVASE